MSHARVVARASWRCIWHPGTDHMTLASIDSGWRISGHANLEFAEGPTAFRYRVQCNARWEPQAADVVLRSSAGTRRVEILNHEGNEWSVAGFPNAALRGCTDLDFAATPSTNTLALNRLALAVGETAEILVAWVLFPDLTPMAVRQRYTRLAQRRYRFEALHNNFSREFDVDDRNVVTWYQESWEPIAAPRRAAGVGIATRRRRAP